MDRIIFGSRVHAARKQVGMTTERLAELCDCTPVSIRQIESGSRLPSIPKLVDLCNMLKVAPNELLGKELTFPIGQYDEMAEEGIQKLVIRMQMLPKEKRELVFAVLETLISQIEHV